MLYNWPTAGTNLLLEPRDCILAQSQGRMIACTGFFLDLTRPGLVCLHFSARFTCCTPKCSQAQELIGFCCLKSVTHLSSWPLWFLIEFEWAAVGTPTDVSSGVTTAIVTWKRYRPSSNRGNSGWNSNLSCRQGEKEKQMRPTCEHSGDGVAQGWHSGRSKCLKGGRTASCPPGGLGPGLMLRCPDCLSFPWHLWFLFLRPTYVSLSCHPSHLAAVCIFKSLSNSRPKLGTWMNASWLWMVSSEFPNTWYFPLADSLSVTSPRIEPRNSCSLYNTCKQQ